MEYAWRPQRTRWFRRDPMSSDKQFLLPSTPKIARIARFVPNSILFSRMDTQEPAIALTFDDGPHPEFTPAILETLKEWRAHATFFVVGDLACRYPDLIKRIVAEGHSVGNHT